MRRWIIHTFIQQASLKADVVVTVSVVVVEMFSVGREATVLIRSELLPEELLMKEQ